MQPASTAGEMVAPGKICSVWLYFDEEESDKKVVCRLCKQKLAYDHLTGGSTLS